MGTSNENSSNTEGHPSHPAADGGLREGDTAAADSRRHRSPEEAAAGADHSAIVHPEALVEVTAGHMPAESIAEHTRLVDMGAGHIHEEGRHYSRDCESAEGGADVADNPQRN